MDIKIIAEPNYCKESYKEAKRLIDLYNKTEDNEILKEINNKFYIS